MSNHNKEYFENIFINYNTIFSDFGDVLIINWFNSNQNNEISMNNIKYIFEGNTNLHVMGDFGNAIYKFDDAIGLEDFNSSMKPVRMIKYLKSFDGKVYEWSQDVAIQRLINICKMAEIDFNKDNNILQMIQGIMYHDNKRQWYEFVIDNISLFNCINHMVSSEYIYRLGGVINFRIKAHLYGLILAINKHNLEGDYFGSN